MNETTVAAASERDYWPREDLSSSLVELIRRAATDLPADVETALRQARRNEDKGSAAQSALDTILENVGLARELSRPICQDTGTPIFWVRHPQEADTRDLMGSICGAVRRATQLSYLRPNAVDAVTGINSGDNTGAGFPTVHFEQHDADHVQVDLLLKGGGSENVCAQYALPYAPISAGRDLEGVRRVVLDAVYQAQGKGCAPAVLGIAVGGDRGTGYLHAKRQLMRPIGDANPDPLLADLEERLFEDGNRLGIGPMGFGGRTTVLGAKVGALHRLPACYFVSVAYMCWACRRSSWDERSGYVSLRPQAGEDHTCRPSS
jgi:fumarate hydratase class I